MMILPLSAPKNTVRVPSQLRLSLEMESFHMSFYCLPGSRTLSSLRWELFRSKNQEGTVTSNSCRITTSHPPCQLHEYEGQIIKGLLPRCFLISKRMEGIQRTEDIFQSSVLVSLHRWAVLNSSNVHCSCKVGCKGRCSFTETMICHALLSAIAMVETVQTGHFQGRMFQIVIVNDFY